MSSVYDKMTEIEREAACYLEEKGVWWQFEFEVARAPKGVRFVGFTI